MSAQPDLRFYHWLWQPDDVRELRALGKFTQSGYFDAPETLALTAQQLSADERNQGIYISLNPVEPDLMGRSARRVKMAKRGETTTDNQIIRRTIMLVDCDPVRPSGINSTDEQHLLALELADRIRNDMEGWPEPAMVDTGNGAALWYAIDEPTKDDGLVQTCLQALAHRYDSEQIKIDLKVFNPSRIARIPGTLNRKGDNLPDRPQRRCKYLTVPPARIPVPTALLEALAATLPKKQAAQTNDAANWLDRWVLEHGEKLNLQGPEPWKQGGRIWTMDVCPWRPDHDDHPAFLAQHDSGAICAGCHHNSCTGNDWHALRDLVEPGWRNKGDYALTELGNAEMLLDNFGDKLRFVQDAKPHWLAYDGIAWSYDVCRAGHLANLIALKRLEEAQDKEQKKWAMQCQSTATRNGTLAQASTLPGMAIKEQDLDQDRWLLNFRNGTLDLRDGQLRPHDPKDHLTRALVMEYDPNATCELWLAFLDKIMGGKQEMVDFLQRALGYALTGSTQEQKIFLLHGAGANGKSTLLETWMDLMGEYARKADTETFLQGKKGAIREDLLDLQGARLVAVTEINEGRRLDEALVKEFSGGDRVSTRGLYKERVNLRIEGKLWMATNDKPDIRAGGHGIWRRMLYIPFEVVISNEERDPLLPGKLLREGPGILAWAVRGCLAWQDKGLQPPDYVLEQTKAYEEEQDLVGEWLTACCVIGPNCRASATGLYDSFTAYVGSEVCSRTTFFRRLAKRPGLVRDRSNAVRFWKGVGLKSEPTGVTDVTDGDRYGDRYERRSEAIVTDVTDNLSTFMHEEVNDVTMKHDVPRVEKSVASAVTSVTAAVTEGKITASGCASKPVTDKIPYVSPVTPASPWGSCSSCNLTLSGPSGGTGLCSKCLPKPRR